jgi:splicing factor 3B subunit 3
LDHNTIAGGDKFGTLFVNRLDAETAKAITDDKTGNLAMHERGFLQGAPHKLTNEVSFFVGESISSISRTVLIPGGNEVLFYTTLLGTAGVLIPFTSKSDFEFFQLLEMTLRQELPPLSGHQHLLYRGCFSPLQNTIDGDLCEMFNQLSNEKKRAIADSLDRSVAEVAKKLDDVRNAVAF